MINYKYVLFKTEPGIGFGGYSDEHYEVHRLLSTANVELFNGKLSDYYASVETIIVSTDEQGIVDYCKDNEIVLDIEYEKKWYGCYESNSTYDGTFIRGNSTDGSVFPLWEVDESPRDGKEEPEDIAEHTTQFAGWGDEDKGSIYD